MGAPRLLVLNYFNDVQHAAHVLSASHVTGDAWKVGAGRREPTHYWQADATAQTWVKVDCGSAKPASDLRIDRVHNLAGLVDVKLQRSANDSAWTDVLTFTIPAAASAPDTALSSGARTPEGAYVRSFASVSDRYWRLLMPSLGGGLRHQVGGLYVGPGYTPPNLSLPFGDDEQEPLGEETETPWGWTGGTLTVPRRAGELILKLRDEAGYADAATHIRDQFVKRPMWIVFDDGQAERAVLARWPKGVRAGFRREGGGYRRRQIRLPWLEHQPKVE